MAGPNPRLIGISGPFKYKSVPLDQAEICLGREPSNQLWASDSALSRRHCLFNSNGDGKCVVRDLESHNGTFVNGVEIEEQELRHGDQISVGDSTLIFLLDDRETRLERNPVRLTDTAELRPAFLLRPEDGLYLRPNSTDADIPRTDRAARDLDSLLRVAVGVGAIRDWESLQWQLLGLIFDVVPADRGVVLLCETVEAVESVAAWDRLRGPGHPVRLSRTVLRRVLKDATGLLVGSVPGDPELSQVSTVAELGVQALLCVPLVVFGKVRGVIYLDSQVNNFDENHLQAMTGIAAIASLALDNVRHWEGLREENQILRAQIELEHDMVGASAPMREVFEFIRKAAPTDSTVLIHGESGTGKELVARALHRNSARTGQAFMAINCATLTETLLESELFGHEKGAFTGALVQKKGKLEVASGGTLFLDEVSEMSPLLQAKLLRVLQEREFERLGGTKTIKVDVRVIAATNKSSPEAVEGGRFRGDLYYRLNVVALTLPPLRERQDDIAALADHFIVKASRKCKTPARRLSPEARACLMSYEWPGNVRELENAIERALVLGSGDSIEAEDLPEPVVEAGPPVAGSLAKYHGAIKDLKKQLVARAFQESGGNYIEAAKTLGMHPNSFLRLVRNLGLKAAAKAGTKSPGAA